MTAESRNIEVAVVDDDKLDRFLTRRVIERVPSVGTVTEFASGDRFVDALDHGWTGEGPLLVLLDINMPGLNGFEVLEQLESRGLAERVRVAMLTSSSHPRDRDAARRFSSVVGFIEKPLTAQHLVEFFETALAW